MKFLKVFITFLLVCSFVFSSGALAVEASETNVVNLVDNGDFNRLYSDGKPCAWGFSDTSLMQIVSTGGYENSAYLMQSGTESSYASHSVGGIKGGSTYTFSAYVRVASPAVAVFKMEWYAMEDGNLSFISAEEHIFSEAFTAWKTVSHSFSAPTKAVKGTLLVRKIGKGAVCWDAVSVSGTYERNKINSSEPRPALGGTGECLVNGGFESIKDGEASSWAKGGEYFSLETDRPFDGSTSIRMENNDASKSPWLRQVYTAVEGGSLYQLSYWVSPFLSEGYFSFKLEFYNSTACSAATHISANVCPGTNASDGVWRQIVIPIRMPDNCKSIAVYPRLYSAVGRVYFDNISLVKTGVRTPLKLSTDAIFYYSDREENGVATMESTAFYTEDSTDRVEFTLFDGSSAVKKQETVSFADGKAEFQFPLSLIEKERTAYFVRAKALSKVGTTLEEQTVSVYKYPRPGMLDKDGNCKIDGEIFSPVISYHHHPRDYAQAVRMGVNVVQSYGMGGTEILDEAAKYNIKVLMVLYDGMKPAGHPDNIEKTRATVNAVKDHPALFGYAIMDEPYYNYTAPEDWLLASYKAIRDMDSYHPVYVCENTREHLNQSQKYVDVLCIDPYIADKSDAVLTHVYDETVFAVENTEPGKPVYALLQAFDFKGYFPTGEELRHQLYQAFMGGAKGVGYYCFADAKDGKSLDETEIWDSIRAFASDELESASFGFVEGNLINKITGTNTDAAYWKENEVVHLVLQNKTNTVQTGTVVFFDFIKNAELSQVLGDGIGSLNGSAFTYRIEDSATVRFTFKDTENIWNENLLPDTGEEPLQVIEKTVYNLQEGKRYKLSFLAKCETVDAAPRVRLSFTNQKNTSENTVFSAQAMLDGVGKLPVFGKTTWQNYEVTFRVPEGADCTTILLGRVTNCHYDNLTLKRETEEVSFYNEDGALVLSKLQVTETVQNKTASTTYDLAAIRGEGTCAAEADTKYILHRICEAQAGTLISMPIYKKRADGKQELMSIEMQGMQKGGYICKLQALPEESVFRAEQMQFSAQNLSPIKQKKVIFEK